MNKDITLLFGDCLEVMKSIPGGSVDMILCDLPYGITSCKWDSVIPFEPLWLQYNRIVKDNAAIVLTASQPFTTALIWSNMRGFCYSWVWNKRFAANFVQAKRQPLKTHEDVIVFSRSGKMPPYYPIKTPRDKPIRMGKNHDEHGAFNIVTKHEYDRKEYTDKYPESIITFSSRDGSRGLHPTQKPVALMEYLIKTYSKEGDLILDNCMGSGTTGVACINTNRRFIGIEKDEKYFEIASNRINEALSNHEANKI